MMCEFAGLVADIKRNGKEPDNQWPAMTRKTTNSGCLQGLRRERSRVVEVDS